MSRFLFRCDVSATAGTGHLRRCLTLAKELKERGAFIFFLCRSDKGFDWMSEAKGVADSCQSLGWEITPDEDADAVVSAYTEQGMDKAVIDHYRADEKYQKRLHESGVRWLQFDGFAQQPLWADWVFNANPSVKEDAYRPLKRNDRMQFLLGPPYALIRREFGRRREEEKANGTDKVHKVLLTFGGGDDKGCTVFCLESLKSLDRGIERIVLVNSMNPRLPEIRNWIDKNKDIPVRLLIDEPEIARCMADADLAVISGGVTTFETAAMGLPSLIIQIADNQSINADAWEKHNVSVNLGPLQELSAEDLRSKVEALIKDSQRRRAMGETAKGLVDGLGAERVAQVLI